MRHIPQASKEDQGARRRRSGGASRDSGSADELGEAIEPSLLCLRRGAVLQQLLRHEKRSCRAGRRTAQRRGSAVPRRMQRRGLLLAVVALGVGVIVVFRGMLDAGLGVDVVLRSSASWSSASARAATWAASGRSGGDACHPASVTFGARAGHDGVEVEDAPQPPTWRAKCRRIGPGTRRISRNEGFDRGLNTQSSDSQLTTTTLLAGVGEEGTAQGRRSVLPRFRALERGKTPTSCLAVLLVEVLSTRRACGAQGGYNG